MKEDTKRLCVRVKRSLETCLEQLHAIHNEAYSRCDTEAMSASYPAWEGVKTLLESMPTRIKKTTLKKVHKHLP